MWHHALLIAVCAPAAAMLTLAEIKDSRFSAVEAWRQSVLPLLQQATLLRDNAQPATGLAATVSLNGLRALSRGLVPILEDVIPAITLPDVPFNELTLEGNLTGLRCTQALIGGLDVQTDASSGVQGETFLLANAYNLSLLCTADFSYREEHWPYWPSGQGSMELQVAGANIASRVAIRSKYPSSNSCAATPTGTGTGSAARGSGPRPGVGQSLCLSTQDVTVDAGEMQVRFKAGQPVLVWILNLLVSLFRGSVQSSLTSRAQEGIRKAIDETASGALQAATQIQPVEVPVPSIPPAIEVLEEDALLQALAHWSQASRKKVRLGRAWARGAVNARAKDEPIVLGLRTTLSESPHVHGNSSYEPGKGHVHLSMRADVIPSYSQSPHAALPLVCPPKPALGPSAPAHHVQMWVSNYSIASPLYAIAASGAARLTVPPTVLPEAFNTSEHWEPIVPALPQAFGTGVGVGLRVSIPKDAALPQVNGSAWPAGQGSLSLSLCPQVEVQVYEEEGGPGITAVRWNGTLLVNASLWVPAQGDSEPAMLHLNISSASLVMDGEDVWTAPALAKDPTVHTDMVNRLLDMGLGRVLLPLINRALSKGIQLPVLPLGPLPGTHGGEAQMVGLQLTNTRLFASGPNEDAQGGQGGGEGAGIDGSPTASTGMFLKTDVELVVQPMKRYMLGVPAAWAPLALPGEGADPMRAWQASAAQSASREGRSIGRLGSPGKAIAFA